MSEKERLPSKGLVVNWKIERATNEAGQRFVALTFTPYRQESLRIVLHWGEAEKFSAALAEDVRLHDPHREHRERYRQNDPDQER